MALAFFFAALAVCSIAQELQCDFQMRTASMTSGYVNGHMVYSWSKQFFLTTYTTSGTKNLYQFNSNNGYTNFNTQYEYTFSATCPCSIDPISAAQPVLYPSSTLLKASGSGFVPQNTASLLSSVSFGSDNYPTTAKFTDGSTYVFSNCKPYTVSAADNTAPTDCSCGKPIDVVLVLDRSSSISNSEFVLEKQFTQNLVAAFTYGPLAVNLGITNFHTYTWDGPVTLSQGNSAASVNAGASALQCAPNGQCLVYGSYVPSGSCCGSGTSISAGIVNGADMLATASSNGVRASAAKVLIVLTDGYHNKVLKKDASGNLIRDASGKPQGVPFTVNGATCNEDASQTSCSAGLLSDLQWAVKYAVQKVPTVSIFGIGVGTIWDKNQLLAIANGDASNVFGTTDWNQLSSLVDDLVLETCQQSPDNPACTGCCGFCSCSGCVAPDGCDPASNFCNNVNLQGTCCTTVPKPATTCQKADLCSSYSCDATANSGAGACKSTVNPITPNTTCAGYNCDPATGKSVYTDLCPPKCFVDKDCNDNNACTIDKCVIPTSDPHSAYCSVTPRDCAAEGKDLCSTYTCDKTTGCSSTKKPLPANNTCAMYTCDPTTGLSNYTNLCPGVPDCVADSDCDDSNPCTVDKCYMPNIINVSKCVYTDTDCTGSDMCQIYSCNPALAGGCTSTPKPFAANTTCSGYTCDSATGNITYTDLCPPQPPCLVDTDCNDFNACTQDTCVLNATAPLSNFCNWTDIAHTCDDGNACTNDMCNTTTGCVNEDIDWVSICNDNDLCTIDTCNPNSTNATFPCTYTNVTCNQTDICHQTKCYPQQGCLVLDIVCPTSDNCTVSGCNNTPGEGCYINKAGVCGFPAPVVIGIAAGVIAGIVVAAVAGALIVGGGTAYAFTQGAGAGLGATVSNSPIYAPAGEKGYSPLHKV